MADFSAIFEEYRQIRNDADKLFERVSGMYPACVTCRPGCSDCCHALFDLSLVEAMYINEAFAQNFDYGPKRSAILEAASVQDRALTRLKREMYRAEKNGENQDKIMNMAASARMRCPLLDDDNRCLMYEERPITCRLYGIPVAIDGKSHVCGFSNFEPGHDYPAVQLGRIQARLDELGRKIADATGSSLDLEDIYVPLSMALLTKYDKAWFGLEKEKDNR